jgi:rare lipoprotein A
MRTLLTVVGFLGILLIMLPDGGYSASSRGRQEGCATWYGKEHHGRKTASGERFSRWKLTAAHRSLPLGTKVKVTNPRTGRHVMVTINDRGPYGKAKRCVIDLSEEAAKRLGVMGQGVAQVQLMVMAGAS